MARYKSCSERIYLSSHTFGSNTIKILTHGFIKPSFTQNQVVVLGWVLCTFLVKLVLVPGDFVTERRRTL